MDKSQEYINMCKEAKEVQASWKPQAWDYIYRDELPDYWLAAYIENKVYVLSGYETDGDCYGPSLAYFDDEERELSNFLPRQDQLQDLYMKDCVYAECGNKTHCLIDEFQQFCLDQCPGQTSQMQSVEQLWLSFVMYMKYQKLWDGKEWVNIAKLKHQFRRFSDIPVEEWLQESVEEAPIDKHNPGQVPKEEVERIMAESSAFVDGFIEKYRKAIGWVEK